MTVNAHLFQLSQPLNGLQQGAPLHKHHACIFFHFGLVSGGYRSHLGKQKVPRGYDQGGNEYGSKSFFVALAGIPMQTTFF